MRLFERPFYRLIVMRESTSARRPFRPPLCMSVMDSHDGIPRSFNTRRFDGKALRDESQSDSHAAPSAPVEMSGRVGEALLFLLKAKEYADDVATDLWDFALELRELRSLGLTNSDLRWLVMKGYVDFARELTEPGDYTVDLYAYAPWDGNTGVREIKIRAK